MESSYSSCALILLESPEKVSIGFDNLSLKTGQLFKGIKDIPPGAHFLHTLLKIGKSSMFLFFSPQDVITLKWDSSFEDFKKFPPDEADLYASSILEFLPMMVKYPNESLSAWKGLTSHITKNTIEKLDPLKHSISSEDREYDISSQEFESFSTSKAIIYYSSIPKRWVKHGLSASEITENNFDKSQILIEMLQKDFEKKTNDLLGEFQFAYISFLIGESLESFEQWKNILVLVCNCDRALVTHCEFFIKFIPVVYSHVQSLPKDLIFDPFLSSSFITSSLKAFLSLLDNKTLHKALISRGEKLKTLVKNEFGITEFEMLDDEESPCIVDI